LLLPIGGGIKLQPGQTRVLNTAFLQVIEELIPRLNRLAAAGKVYYKLMPAAPTDVGTLDTITAGIQANPGAGTFFANANYIGTVAESVSFIADRPKTIQNMVARLVNPTITGTVKVVLYVNATASSMSLVVPQGSTAPVTALTIPPVGPQDVVDLNAGDRVAFACTFGDTNASGLMITATTG